MIRDELKGQKKPIDSVKQHPKNVRQGDVGAIAQSLEAHGQYAPIIVQRSTGRIVKGNHTWQAAKQLGWTEIAVLELDLTDRKALELLLTDNKTSDQAMYDENALAELLESLSKEKRSLEGTGYTGDDLDDLLASLQERFQPSTTPYNPDTRHGEAPSITNTVTTGGSFEGKSHEYFDNAYSPTAVRGITLDYPIREFTWVVEQLAKLREKMEVTSNAEVIANLVAEATNTAKPT